MVDVAETVSVGVPVADAVPTFHADIGEIGSDVPLASEQNDTAESSENSHKLAALMAMGGGALAYVKTIDPLQGVSSFAEASVKIKKEAKNLFNPTAFSKPKDRAELQARVSANLSYFRMTYMVSFLVLSLYYLLTSPFLVFEIVLIIGLWALFFKFNKAEDVVKIGKYELGKKEKMMVLVPLTTFVAFFGGLLSTLIYVLIISVFLVGAHASFREIIEPDPLDELENMSDDRSPPSFV